MLCLSPSGYFEGRKSPWVKFMDGTKQKPYYYNIGLTKKLTPAPTQTRP